MLHPGFCALWKQQNHFFSYCDLQLLHAELWLGNLEMEMSWDRRKVHVCNSFPPSLSPPPLLPPTYASNKSVFVSSADYGAFVRAPHCQACWSQGLPLAQNMNLNKIDLYISQPKTDGCWITGELSKVPRLGIYTSKKGIGKSGTF